MLLFDLLRTVWTMSHLNFLAFLVVISAHMAVVHYGVSGTIRRYGMIWATLALGLVVANLVWSWDYTTPDQAAAAFMLFMVEFLLVVRAGYVRFVLPTEK